MRKKTNCVPYLAFHRSDYNLYIYSIIDKKSPNIRQYTGCLKSIALSAQFHKELEIDL